MDIAASALTHPGLRRDSNEDSFRAIETCGLFVVADGMGGHAAGEVASLVAVEAVEEFIRHSDGLDSQYVWPFGFEPSLSTDGNRLVSAFRLANRHIQQRTIDEPALRGMATTAVALLVAQPPPQAQEPRTLSALVAHVGDSRAYVWREGRLEQITRDHSWVEEQIAAGAMTEEDARRHPWRNLVTRALSGGDDPDIDVTPLALEPGDRVLICSDGLTTPVPDAVIAEVLGRTPRGSLDAICQALVDAANAAGGPDNITVVLVEVSRDSG